MRIPHDGSLLQAALDYVRRGYPVIPLCPPDHKGMSKEHIAKCQHPGKTPLIEAWGRYATQVPTEVEVRSWWQRWPNANVGGPTGPLWGIALDVDPRKGGDVSVGGPECPIPETVTSITGGGGAHYLFAWSDDLQVGNRVGFNPGVDVRGLGGQIVLPPSLHVLGSRYTWEIGYAPDEHPPAELPDWLLKALHEAKADRGEHGKPEYANPLDGVPEGQRNETAARLAGHYLRRGLSEAEVLDLLRSWNIRNMPPMEEAELKAVVNSIAERDRVGIEKPGDGTSGKGGGGAGRGRGKRSYADLLLQLVREGRALLFTDHQGEGYVAPEGDGTVVHRLDSRATRRWLSRLLFAAAGKAPSGEALQTAILTLEAIADAEGPRIPLEVRVAWQNGVVWYDLGREAVRIDNTGWQLIESPPVLFARFPHQVPQVKPVSGDFNAIDAFLPCGGETALLLKVWALAALVPDGPRPLLDLGGPQGSGKSTTAKVLKRLIDPSIVLTMRRISDAKELSQVLAQNWAVFFDNIGHLSADASDGLSAAVSGDGDLRRKLYTDTDAVTFVYRRVISLNAISHTAQRPDLLDRTLLVTLQRISPEAREDEAAFEDRFKAALPGILGGAFDILAKAIALRPEVHLAVKPRMADFAVWGYAIAEAAGWGGERFLAAYERNVGRQHEEAVAASVVAQAIVAFMEGRDVWEGPASALKTALDPVAEQQGIDLKSRWSGWPADAPRLSKEVRRLAETLAAGGLEVSYGFQGKTRSIRLRKIMSRLEGETTVGTVGAVGAATQPTDSKASATDGKPPITDGKDAAIPIYADTTDGADGKKRPSSGDVLEI